MKFECFVLLFIITSCLPPNSVALGPSCSTLCQPFDPIWGQFKHFTKRRYQADEEKERYTIFVANMNQIEDHNMLYRENVFTFNLEINQFGDLTEREFMDIMFGYKRTNPVYFGSAFYSFAKLTFSPRSLDLRLKGMVTPVKNQGMGSFGGIFAAIGVLEGLHFKLTNQLVPLSEQHVLDCAWDPKFGGVSFSRAMSFLTKVGAVAEEDYPFEGKRGNCRQLGKRIVIKFERSNHVAKKDQIALEAILDQVGPVSIQMAPSYRLQFYRSGIYRDHSRGRATGFVALVVGYGSDPEHGAYWLVKNCWGQNWGENGYIRIAKSPNGLVENGISTFPVV